MPQLIFLLKICALPKEQFEKSDHNNHLPFRCLPESFHNDCTKQYAKAEIQLERKNERRWHQRQQQRKKQMVDNMRASGGDSASTNDGATDPIDEVRAIVTTTATTAVADKRHRFKRGDQTLHASEDGLARRKSLTLGKIPRRQEEIGHANTRANLLIFHLS
jgi:hypothetical protein